jgi:hypothetical protein
MTELQCVVLPESELRKLQARKGHLATFLPNKRNLHIRFGDDRENSPHEAQAPYIDDLFRKQPSIGSIFYAFRATHLML